VINGVELVILLTRRAEESIDAGRSANYIQEKFVDFENGFHKATAGQKKRLIRKAIKHIALTKENLALWLYMADEDETPGRKLKLVRDKTADGGLSLASVKVSKPPVGCLDISGNGVPGMSRTCGLRFRKPPLYPAELRGHLHFLYKRITRELH
jgi:hypothetical protein